MISSFVRYSTRIRGAIMKNEIVNTSIFCKDRAIEIAGTLEQMDELHTKSLLTSIIHDLEKLVLKNEMYDVKEAEVQSFLRIISKSIQRESRKNGAWKFYLYGKYDSRQEDLLSELQRKVRKEQREKVLRKKHVPKILQYLYAHGASRHGEIAKDLGIDPANLSRLMDELSGEELVERTKIRTSSFTIYELTREGYQICTNYYRQKAVMDEDIQRYSYPQVGTLEKGIEFSQNRYNEYKKNQLDFLATSNNDTRQYFTEAAFANQEYNYLKVEIEKGESSENLKRQVRALAPDKPTDNSRKILQYIGGYAYV